MRRSQRRPIETDEIDNLQRLGAELRHLRYEAGMSQEAVSRRAQLGTAQVSAIELGTSRTRRSTLERLLVALGRPEQLDQCINLAGTALAPESRYAERIEQRRKRRWTRRLQGF